MTGLQIMKSSGIPFNFTDPNRPTVRYRYIASMQHDLSEMLGTDPDPKKTKSSKSIRFAQIQILNCDYFKS